jgi:mannosyltransferase
MSGPTSNNLLSFDFDRETLAGPTPMAIPASACSSRHLMLGHQTIDLDCVIFGLQRFGGISNYWARLLDQATVSPHLTTRLVLPRQLSFQEFDPAWTRGLAPLRERLSAQVSRYMRAPVPDRDAVFHTSYYRLPRSCASRYVVSAYDFTYERYRSGLARYVHTTQKFASLHRANAVLCISHSTKRDVLEFCKGIDPAKLHVTHLGVDSGMFFPEAAKIAGHEATVLFVGQRTGYKRFDLAVDAVRQCPRLRLGIVGPALTGAERDMLQAKLGSRWHGFGPVGTAELRRLYSSVLAFIFPSDYEGFGLPVLEAMACGCPVLAANASSLPEVGAGAASYAAEQRADAYSSSLDELCDSTTRATKVRAGIARAAEFSWSKTFDQTLAIYFETQ